MVYFVQGGLGLARLVVNFNLKDDLHLDLVEAIVISSFSVFCDLSNLYMSLLVILSPSLRIEEVLSRLISTLSWSLMTTFVDNKYNVVLSSLSPSWIIIVVYMVIHKAPQDLFSVYVGVLWPLEEL
ncbi:Folate-biopterin transporter 1, chloroplastic, partial [Mucuna pruriens]